jgi:GNAT superfamily N-acetyltransferase
VTCEIAILDGAGAAAAADDLGNVLADCVAGGASVSFMASFGAADAAQYFRGLIDEIAAGKAILLAARQNGRIVGTAQLALDTPPNQPHRADVRKVLVHRSARKQGVADALMREIEAVARRHARTLLVLDTVTGGDAERLYTRLGWQRVGVIPDYALWPDGRFCDTTVFYKRIAP